MNRTTDLTVVRLAPHAFTWGTVRKIHDVGPYCLVEYEDRDQEIRFHVYVDGRSTSNSCETMDEALLYAIAYSHLEINDAGHMARAATRLFNIKD